MDEPKILVAIRKRPLSKKEQSKGQTDIIAVKNRQTVIVSEYKQKVDLTKYLEETVFNFDFAFNQQTTNEQIYEQAVRPLVDSAFQGAKVTCFAYGQTGSGKTFTMNGNQKMGVYGLYTLGANDIFAYLTDSRFRHLTAKVSYFQIYCNKLFDLLNKRQELTLRQDNKSNINIIGLQQTQIDSIDRFQQLLNYGSTNRITSQNSANAQSSRSHAILQVTLKDGKKVFGRISFIDLAGNERGADHTDMKKQTRIDGAEINKSLLSLKQCIRALDQGKGHTPFRGSKLTMVLKDSFVGFCRTIMIGNVSPSSASSQNTLNTLRYADRVKQLRKPTEGLSKQQMKAREMMLPRQNKNAIKIDINNDDDAEDIQAKRKQAQKNYGIKEQSPRQNKQMQQRQMSSDPYRRNLQSERSRQQSFGGPSVSLTRPLVGGLMKQSQGPSTLQPPQMSSPQGLNKQPKSPVVSTNLTKIAIGNTQKAPINSERSINPSTNQTSNNSSMNQYQQQYMQQQPGLQRTNSININGPKAMFDSRMDVEENNMSNSQFVQRQNNFVNNSSNNQPNSYNNNQMYYSNNTRAVQSQSQNSQSNYSYNNYNNSASNNNQNNPNNINNINNINKFGNPVNNQNNQNNQINQMGSLPQNQQNVRQNMQPAQLQNNRMVGQPQQFNEPNRLDQYRSNYQQPQMMPQQQQQPQQQPLNRLNQFRPQAPPPPPQKVSIPQDWQGMIQFVSTTSDPQLRHRIHQKIHEQLFQQQNQLIGCHSDTLRSSLDCLKSQMNLIADLQSNRDAIGTREYLSLMQDSIDEKISLLEMLRQKMIQFTYKLDRVQEIDQQNQNVGPREDQQLLDDLH